MGSSIQAALSLPKSEFLKVQSETKPYIKVLSAKTNFDLLLVLLTNTLCVGKDPNILIRVYRYL